MVFVFENFQFGCSVEVDDSVVESGRWVLLTVMLVGVLGGDEEGG